MNDFDHPSLASLREATAAMLSGLLEPTDVTELAADLLAAGNDGEPLVALASLYSSATSADVFDLSSATLGEAGAQPLDREGPEIPLLALRVACRRFLTGRWELRSFSSWVHSRIGHEGPRAAQPLVEVDDILDDIETRSIRGGRRFSQYRLEVARLAADFLVDTEALARDSDGETSPTRRALNPTRAAAPPAHDDRPDGAPTAGAPHSRRGRPARRR